ncbi:hypothetical protein ACIPJG_32430 [Streptomyces halstedii]|uniref:hypothetical protein n=1 Tax=Streptomyces halstedii TaxID=1944 RepID=UPI003830A9DD
MKQRIEFKAFITVYDEPLTADEAQGWAETALRLGDKHAGEYAATMVEVTSFSTVGDDE